MKRKDLKTELARAISSTYYHATTGTSVSVRVATPSSSTTTQTLANILEAIPQIVALIPEGWENILSLGIKTSNSVFLPVYQSKLEGRFDAPASKEQDEGMEVEEEVPATKKAKKEPEAAKAKTKAAGTGVKEKKKSSTIGSGAAARKTKQGAVGTKSSKVKA